MIEYVAETGSTNTDLAECVRSGDHVSEGHWLVADRQVAGRGRQGRNWSDGAGNFMGSTIVRPSASDPPAPSLALLAGLALHEISIGLVPDPTQLTLKWPNDLNYGRAKMAGILLEGEGAAVVIGIGVNLVSAPDLPDRETLAFSAFGPAPDRDSFANSLAASFARELERWRTYGLDPVVRRWLAVGTPIGTQLSVHDGNAEPLSGEFAGLTGTGALLLSLPDGATREVHAGDVMLA